MQHHVSGSCPQLGLSHRSMLEGGKLASPRQTNFKANAVPPSTHQVALLLSCCHGLHHCWRLEIDKDYSNLVLQLKGGVICRRSWWRCRTKLHWELMQQGREQSRCCSRQPCHPECRHAPIFPCYCHLHYQFLLFCLPCVWTVNWVVQRDSCIAAQNLTEWHPASFWPSLSSLLPREDLRSTDTCPLGFWQWSKCWLAKEGDRYSHNMRYRQMGLWCRLTQIWRRQVWKRTLRNLLLLQGAINCAQCLDLQGCIASGNFLWAEPDQDTPSQSQRWAFTLFSASILPRACSTSIVPHVLYLGIIYGEPSLAEETHKAGTLWQRVLSQFKGLSRSTFKHLLLRPPSQSSWRVHSYKHAAHANW